MGTVRGLTPILALFFATFMSAQDFQHLSVRVLPGFSQVRIPLEVRRIPRRVHSEQPQQFRIYAPIFSEGTPDESELMLNNNGVEPLSVLARLFLRNGQLSSESTILLGPGEVRFVRGNELLHKNSAEDWGFIELNYVGKKLQLGAEIVLAANQFRPSVNFLFSPHNPLGSNELNSVWWFPAGASTQFFIANISDLPVHVSLTTSGGDSRVIHLEAHQTRAVRLGPLSRGVPQAASAHLNWEGQGGVIKAAGFVYGEAYTTGITFHDPSAARDRNIYATNLPLKNSSPHLVLSNVGATPLHVAARFLPLNGELGGALEIPNITLESHESKAVELDDLDTRAAADPNFQQVSVQLLSSGYPGQLIGALSSTGRNGLTNEVHLRDLSRIAESTGSYPVRWDGDFSTVVTISNVANQEMQFSSSLQYAGGIYVFGRRTLQAGETAVFDMSDLKRSKVVDQFGKSIPDDLRIARFHWSIAPTPGSARLIGRSQMTSASKRVSTTYCAGLCCPDSQTGAFVDPASALLLENSSATAQVENTIYDCYNNGYNQLDWTSFDVDQPSIASVYQNQVGVATEEGHSAGSAIATYTYERDEWYSDGRDCYEDHFIGTDSVPLTIKTPFQVEPIGTLEQGAAACASGTAGWSRLVVNQLQDQTGMAITIPGITMADQINLPGAHTGTADTDANGGFPDSYFICTADCPGSVFSADGLQNWTYNGVPLSHVNAVHYTCSSVTVDGR